jgi:hypothetical protein
VRKEITVIVLTRTDEPHKIIVVLPFIHIRIAHNACSAANVNWIPKQIQIEWSGQTTYLSNQLKSQ